MQIKLSHLTFLKGRKLWRGDPKQMKVQSIDLPEGTSLMGGISMQIK